MSRVPSVILIIVLVFLPFPVAAAEQVCANQSEVVVLHDDVDSVAEICRVSEQAIAFLAQFDLVPKRKIYLEVVEEKIDSHGYVAYGSYNSRTDRIQLMSYASIQNGSEPPLMYGEPFDRVHYTGAIAHEITHAVVQHHLQSKPLSTGPQEYLAHSTQLAVMPVERRDAVIRAMDIGAWESGDAISDIYMAIEPGKFAVKSYLHLMALDDPASFVKILLNAKWFYVYVP